LSKPSKRKKNGTKLNAGLIRERHGRKPRGNANEHPSTPKKGRKSMEIPRTTIECRNRKIQNLSATG
jgi:hypothetical protein